MEEDGISFRTYPEPDEGGGVPRELPPELLQLTYQNRLRTIGRHLDLNEQRSMLILEVDGGFIVRCVSRTDRDVDLLQFDDDSYVDRMIRATESRGEGERRETHSPVAPTGYEDLLRALGRAVDQRNGSRIVIAEKKDSILIHGEERSGTTVRPFDIDLDESGITAALDEAFRMRSRGRQPGNEG